MNRSIAFSTTTHAFRLSNTLSLCDQPRVIDVSAHRSTKGISKYIEHDPSDDWDAVQAKVTSAMSLSLFTEFSDDDIQALEKLFKKE
ncbi:hypothetical protein VWY15_01740, partial [Phaeobacter sp. Ax3a-5a]|uniref:hypothetical protein n=1 Tax=Phaeobacter sp. Ax3a-5a TaxID=3112436 RepID=UPI003A8C3590